MKQTHVLGFGQGVQGFITISGQIVRGIEIASRR